MNIGVLLSGSGVYDGTEIQEAVFTLLNIDRHGATAKCFAPDIEQHHVVNHIDGTEMKEKRNVLVESARIARGNITDIKNISSDDLDALIIPGGFGTAKNHTKWAFSGPDGDINPEVKRIVNEMLVTGKPIVGLCMGPTTIAKALEGTGVSARLTVGSTESSSPYEIKAISKGMDSIGMKSAMKTVEEIEIDEENKIITAPCYMMDANISQIHDNIKSAIDTMFKML